MLFNSLLFLFVFLPIALLGYEVASRFGRRSVIGWLAFASLAFYAEWRFEFVFLLLGSILLNYTASRMIVRFASQEPLQKKVMIAGVACNLLLLFFYKYLFPSLAGLGRLGILHHQFAGILLPLGISFFTFTQIAYLVDLQQGAAEPQPFLDYVLFVTFFPHLIAGPILHHAEIMPQFKKLDFRLNAEDLSVGFTWFVMGMFKKVILADSIAPAADIAFASPGSLSLIPAWIGVLNYTLQLYFDFSGYSDMAIGLARMFSIKFPLNFDSPYKAASIIDFWSRWHMTLTRYVTAYLYNPISLAVNRGRIRRGQKVSKKGSATLSGFAEMVALPTMISMALIGIWHGAGLQFLIFGLLHGTYITINHAWRIFRKKSNVPVSGTIAGGLRTAASVALTMLCVIVAQVFFRANSTRDAFIMIGGMIGLHGVHLSGLSEIAPSLVRIPARLFIIWLLPNTQQILSTYYAASGSLSSEPILGRTLRWRPTTSWAMVMTVALIMSLAWMENTTRFLYFQF